MKVKELKRLLSYFSDELTVCIDAPIFNSLRDIEEVRGEAQKATGTFFVLLHTSVDDK